MIHHNLYPNLVLGYHGCDRSVGEELLAGTKFRASENDYDWLGPGIYFWEANPKRALSFANEQKQRGRIKNPFVVGAVLTLGNCIDTLNEDCIRAIQLAYERLKQTMRNQGSRLPRNSGGRDRLLRRLDCAVIVMLHNMSKDQNFPKADSLRGLYYEGRRIYRTSGFFDKSHIQICIVNGECIKGIFRV